MNVRGIVTLGIGAVIITGQTGYQQIRLDDVSSIVQYRVTPDFPSSLGGVFDGLLALKPYSLIALGLLVLIATPVLSVAVSVVALNSKRIGCPYG